MSAPRFLYLSAEQINSDIKKWPNGSPLALSSCRTKRANKTDRKLKHFEEKEKKGAEISWNFSSMYHGCMCCRNASKANVRQTVNRHPKKWLSLKPIAGSFSISHPFLWSGVEILLYPCGAYLSSLTFLENSIYNSGGSVCVCSRIIFGGSHLPMCRSFLLHLYFSWIWCHWKSGASSKVTTTLEHEQSILAYCVKALFEGDGCIRTPCWLAKFCPLNATK